MKELEKTNIIVHAKSSSRIEDLGEVLKQHYTIVVFTGMSQNRNPPHMGDWRGFFTIVFPEEKEEDE